MDAGGPGGARNFTWGDFHWRNDDLVKCIFVAQKIKDSAIMSTLIRDHREIDNVTGNDISFLVMFPYGADTSETGKGYPRHSIADVLQEYKIKPETMAGHHASADTINAFCRTFQIRHDNLPAMVVMVSMFPEQPYVFLMDKETSAQDIVAWLRQVRLAVDNLVTKEIWTVKPFTARINAVSARIEAARSQLTTAMSRLAKLLALPPEALVQLVPHISRTQGISQAITATLDEMQSRYERDWTTEKASKALKTVVQRAQALENAVRNATIVNTKTLEDAIASSHNWAERFMKEINAAHHHQMRRKQLSRVATNSMVQMKNLPRKVKVIGGAIAAAERLLKLLGIM